MDLLEGDKKMLVFAHHQEMLGAVQEAVSTFKVRIILCSKLAQKIIHQILVCGKRHTIDPRLVLTLPNSPAAKSKRNLANFISISLNNFM